ncbi:MAG: hypothetical protein IPP32_00430 [Bacteroidetes bacterium]|nr:hypothetical protein [Bacteroidota bacterium]
MVLFKKILLISILLLFTAASSFESIRLLHQKINPIALLDVKDFDCEEKNSESEKSNEKTDKKNAIDDFYAFSKLSYFTLPQTQKQFHNRINFSSSDYSQVIYSPPELL